MSTLESDKMDRERELGGERIVDFRSKELWSLSSDAMANWFIIGYCIFNVHIFRTGPDHPLFGTLSNYLPIVNLSSVFFIIVFFAAKKHSACLHPAYTLLTKIEQWQWSLRIMSTVHALMVAPAALWELSKPAIRADIAKSESIIAAYCVAIFMGYTIVDSYLMFKINTQSLLANTPFIIHHILVLFIAVSGISPLTQPAFAMVAVCTLAMESSTPFMNQIFFGKSCKVPTSSPLVLANSLLFAGSFFTFRICLLTYVLYRVMEPTSQMYSYSKAQIITINVFGVLFWLLNFYWFVKIVNNAIAIIGKSKRASEVKSN